MSKTLICLIDDAKFDKMPMQNFRIVNYPIYRQIVRQIIVFVRQVSVNIVS
jgi:hypothetical protein